MLTVMLETKPDIKMSTEFKKELRDKIMTEIASRKQSSFDLASGIKMISTFIAGAAATYAALQFAVLPDIFTPDTKETPYKSEIIEEKKEAFWDLKKLGLGDTQWTQDAVGAIASNNLPQPQAGISTEREEQKTIAWETKVDTASSEPSLADAMALMDDASMAFEGDISSSLPESPTADMIDAPMAKMIAPMPTGGSSMEPLIAPDYYIPQTFTFSVDTSSIPKYEKTIAVYKLEKNPVALDSVMWKDSSIMKNDLVDLSTLENLSVENISFYEDKNEGYQVSYDIPGGNIYISTRYDKWLFDYSTSLTEKDMLDEKQLIDIANPFLKKFSIDTSSYGEPKLAYNWYRDYQNAENKAYYYFPDTLSLTYPLKVNDMEVYDAGWYPSGLGVSINLKHKKVVSVGPIQKLKLTKSDYDTETSTEKIVEYANKMYNFWGYYNPEIETKSTQLVLINPKLVYLRKYSLVTSKGQEYSEYLVPSLKFEIKDKPKDYYGGDHIIIPIVKDFFEDNQVGYPVPMPLYDAPAGVSPPSPGIENPDAPVDMPTAQPMEKNR